MLEVFRAYFGIAERDDDRTAREKIAGRLLLLDESFREVLPVLFDFLGVPDPGAAGAAHGSRGAPAPAASPCCARSCSATTRRPQLVTLIEDLHWIDAASEAFLAELVEAIGPAPAPAAW